MRHRRRCRCRCRVVHRAFGSKEELFEQAVKSTIDGDFQQAAQAPDPGLAMTSHFVQSRLSPGLRQGRSTQYPRAFAEQPPRQPGFCASWCSRTSSSRWQPGFRKESSEPPWPSPAPSAWRCCATCSASQLRVADDEEIRPMVTKLMRACLGPNAEPGRPRSPAATVAGLPIERTTMSLPERNAPRPNSTSSVPTGARPRPRGLPLDRSHARGAERTIQRGGLSPQALALAFFDWSIHLAAAPGKRADSPTRRPARQIAC